MNYINIYNNIINNSKGRTLEGYSEKHHIKPRCLGGNNSKKNIAILTAREHYLVHLLLVKIYPKEEKLVYAFWMMCNGSRTERPKVCSRLYSQGKEMFSKLIKGEKVLD
jgi:hypothetical protein